MPKHIAQTDRGEDQVISRITKGDEQVATIVINGSPGKLEAVAIKAAAIVCTELDKGNSNIAVIIGLGVLVLAGLYGFFGS